MPTRSADRAHLSTLSDAASAGARAVRADEIEESTSTSANAWHRTATVATKEKGRLPRITWSGGGAGISRKTIRCAARQATRAAPSATPSHAANPGNDARRLSDARRATESADAARHIDSPSVKNSRN